MEYDIVIVGGGPAGLSAALTLGRARRRVLLCDSGPRRNAAATHLHNFVTRDGTPPEEFRRIGREQLANYPNVTVRDAHVASIAAVDGLGRGFEVRLEAASVRTRRLLLCTGMVDQPLPIDGFQALWGRAIFQCPYCHGWEIQDQRWGVLASQGELSMLLTFALMARGWTDKLTVFTGGVEVPAEVTDSLRQAHIHLVTAPIVRLIAADERLDAVELDNGERVPCDALFAHLPQHQVSLVQSLLLELDDHGFVKVDAMKGETSVGGIYAAGDLTTRMQSAILGAAAGSRVASMINVDLATEGTAAAC